MSFFHSFFTFLFYRQNIGLGIARVSTIYEWNERYCSEFRKWLTADLCYARRIQVVLYTRHNQSVWFRILGMGNQTGSVSYSRFARGNSLIWVYYYVVNGNEQTIGVWLDLWVNTFKVRTRLMGLSEFDKNYTK